MDIIGDMMTGILAVSILCLIIMAIGVILAEPLIIIFTAGIIATFTTIGSILNRVTGGLFE